MTDVAIWPFLYGRTRTADYRLMLVPPFLAAERADGLLSDVGRGAFDDQETDRAVCRQVNSRAVGVLTVVFRFIQPTGAYLGQSGDRTRLLLHDEFERPFLLCTGVVIRSPAADLDPAAAQRWLNSADRQHRQAFAASWREDDEHASPRRSTALRLPGSEPNQGNGSMEPVLELPPMDWEPPRKPIPKQLPDDAHRLLEQGSPGSVELTDALTLNLPGDPVETSSSHRRTVLLIVLAACVAAGITAIVIAVAGHR